MQRFSTYIDQHRGEILDLLVSLVEINSYTGNRDGVNRVGDLVASFLAKLGFAETRYPRHQIGDHRVFHRQGVGKQVLFSCHLDTVFPLELGFTRCQLGEDVITGPGVIDMKGGITVLLQALQMLDRLEMRPETSYTIFFAADEETGSEDARELLEQHAPGKDYAFVFECGGADGELVSARKGVGTFRIDIEGRAAHAGNDYTRGINANLEAAHKLIELEELTRLEAGTTVNVGQIAGGIGANTISPHAHLVVEFRYTNPNEADRVVPLLETAAAHAHVPGTRSRLSGRIQRPVMVESEQTHAFLKLVSEVSGGSVRAEKRGGVGDANLIAACGVPTLDGFGPNGGKDHTVEEFLLVPSLFERVLLLARVLVAIERSGERMNRIDGTKECLG